MKKMIAILLSVLTLFAVCACSKDEPRTETKTGDYTPDYGELYYASGDTKFGIMDPAEKVLNALGEPVNGTFESDSCAYQGKDYFYYYDGFEVMVNDVDGVKRITGITVADDYAHHPGELHALLTTARSMPYKRIICAFQPHTYSRTQALFSSFVEELKLADVAVLAEIYAAREVNDIGISSSQLAAQIPGAIYCSTLDQVADVLAEMAQPDDLILTVGAGDIYRAGEKLLAREKKL